MPDPRVVPIDDPADPRVAEFTTLTDAGLRRSREAAEGLYIAEGATVARRAIAAGHRVRAFLVPPGTAADAAALAPAGVPVYTAGPAVMRAVAGFDVHRGRLASMERPDPRSLADVARGARRLMLLEDLADASNVGAVFRSAAALGADGVVVSNRCADPLYRRAVRVSMGTVFQVPWTRVRDWGDAVEWLRNVGFVVVVLSPTNNTTTLDAMAADPPRRLALVVGAEGPGVRPRTLTHRADVVAGIPMAGGVSSLNAATAAAVAMWALRPHGEGQ